MWQLGFYHSTHQQCRTLVSPSANTLHKKLEMFKIVLLNIMNSIKIFSQLEAYF